MSRVPTIELSSADIGHDADEEFFSSWINYVADRIDERCGFEVCVDAQRFGDPGPDVIRGATDEQRETIREAIHALWESGCGDNFGKPRAVVL